MASKVAAKLKVMPQDVEIDLDDLEDQLAAALPDGAKINNIDRENIAFGLVALIPTVIIPDDAGGTDVVEAAFAEVEGVESVSVESVSRI